MNHNIVDSITQNSYANIKLRDILLADDFSKRGRDALVRVLTAYPDFKEELRQFYKDCYIPPCFQHVDESFSEDDSKEEDDFFSNVNIDLRELLTKKIEFEKRLSIANQVNPLLFIRGASGSGKSSYLKWLKANVIPPDAIQIDCNLEYSQVSVEKGGYIFPQRGTRLPSTNGTIPSAPWLFLLHILNHTFDYIIETLYNTALSIEEIKNNFELIYDGNYSNEDDEIFNFIYKTKECLMSCSIEDDKFTRVTKMTLLECLCKYIDLDMESESIFRILRVSTRILLCISDWLEYSSYYFLFDSIENYIDIGKKIYDIDIRIIADSIYKFVTDEVSYFKHLVDKNNYDGVTFQEKFKFLMCVRDSTNRMFSIAVHNYFESYIGNSVDVSHWYNTEEIIDFKLQYFIEKNILFNDHPSIRFFKVTSNDRFVSNRSTMERLEYMYNRNKRRIIQVLISIADSFFHITMKAEAGAVLDVISLDEFEKLWSIGLENPKYNHYRYLCRRATLRLIWNEIANTGYFNSIYLQPKYEPITADGKLIYVQKSAEIHTYARRILILLSTYNHSDPQGYIGFNSLVRGILNYSSADINDNMKVSKDKIREIALVLISLNETRFENEHEPIENTHPNRWANLINVRFNDDSLEGNPDAVMLYKKLVEACEADRDDAKNFGVAITDAGRFLSYMQVDFEFFACRYYHNNTPLPFMKNIESIKEVMNFVFLRARACIYAIVANEFKMCKGNWSALKRKGYHYKNANGTELRYPIRIIDTHIAYIKSLLQVVGDYGNEMYLNNASNDELMQFLNKMIGKYIDIKQQLADSNLRVFLAKQNLLHIKPPYIVSNS